MTDAQRAELSAQGVLFARKPYLRKVIDGEEVIQASMNDVGRGAAAAVRAAAGSDGKVSKKLKDFGGIKIQVDQLYQDHDIRTLAQVRDTVNDSVNGGGIAFARGVEPVLPPSLMSNEEMVQYLAGARAGAAGSEYIFRGMEPRKWTRISRAAVRFIESPAGIGRRLSARVWDLTPPSKARTMSIIAQGIAEGAPAGRIARDLESALVFGGRSGRGIYSKEAQNYIRVARTESTRAYQAAHIATANSRPWADAMEWHLSPSHRIPCVCSTEIIFNGPDPAHPNRYPKGSLPAVPHPNCMCYWTTVIAADVFADLED